MTQDCEHRMQECPLKCGELVQVTKVGEHLVNECSNQSLACPQCGAASCGKKDLTRGTLTNHLVEKCTEHTVCKDCGGSYKLRVNLPGKDYDHICTEFLTRLIREIAGDKAYD